MVSLLVVLFGLAFFLACVLSGLRSLNAGRRGAGDERRRSLARGTAKLLAAALAAVVPWLAVPIAESNTGWVDADHDGMLDGFVNGSYDWVGVNGGAWATAVAAMVVAIVVGLVAVLAALPSDTDRPGS